MSLNPLRRVVLSVTLLATLAQSASAAPPQSSSNRLRLRMPAIVALERAVAIVTISGKKAPISEPEFELLRDAANGRASNWTLADAALISSGVSDQRVLDRYLAKLDKITAQARDLVDDADTKSAKAKALNKFLFNSTLHGGYTAGQVNMCKVLDEGKFQCVSSTILFSIIARRVGLNPVTQQIPGHVFTRVDNVYVEPVNGRVYSKSQHDTVVDDSWKKASESTQQMYGDMRIYESKSLGLIGSVYYDLGVDLRNEGKNAEAVVNYLKAATLDPNIPEVPYTLERACSAWYSQAVKAKQINKAEAIAKLYARLFGDQKNSQQMLQEIAVARQTK